MDFIPSQIKILRFVEGARQATGLTVIIDVFRAFSTACYVMNNGAAQIIPVREAHTALELHQHNPDSILIGEQRGRKLPNFHHNNSPAEIEPLDFKGKRVIHRTSNGTQGLISATQASEVITGGFVNAQAIITYIRQKKAQTVSLVAMGSFHRPAVEDDLCAEYLKDSLEGKAVDFQMMREQIRHSHIGRKFLDPAVTWAPERDFHLCLDLNRFDFVLRMARPDDYPEKGLLILEKVIPQK